MIPASARRRTLPSLDVGNLALLREHSHAAGQLFDDLRLEGADAIDVDRRRAERHAPGLRVPRLVDHLGDMEERLRRDAAAVETDAAGIDGRIHERDLHAAIGRVERRRVSAGTGTDDDDLSSLRHKT